VAFQDFGLPGRVKSASYFYLGLTGGPAAGFRAVGALLGGWTFSAGHHHAWVTDPVYQFINEALARPEADRTALQGRALLAIELLSQAWQAADQLDIALLSSAMALEVLLAEPEDHDKKFRLARRVSYFACGCPNSDRYPDGRRAECPYLTLPLARDGRPKPELRKLLTDIKAGTAPGCTWFSDVLAIYDARSTIVHEGRLRLSGRRERPATSFIAAVLLRPVITWFSEHPNAELAELDAEIAASPSATGGHLS
jgi:hypothetical protein